MVAKKETANVEKNISARREAVIQRIMNLSDEQFKLFIELYSQQERESAPADPVPHRTSA
jgi:hypothetical protein